ncbi:MAG: hypothetical protein ACI8Q1_002306 [Parvicella sp.]|jgi:hypothetical protein
MRRLIKRVVVFVCPIIAFFLLPTIILIFSKENYHEVNELLDSEDDFLLGYAYNESNYKYIKWESLCSAKQVNIVALGSSRVLKFREQMFTDSFYNAGYSIKGICDFDIFIRSIPVSQHPQYLIVGLDQWMFNANWDNLKVKPSKGNWSESFATLPSFATNINIYQDLLGKKYNYYDFNQKDARIRIGLNAFVNDKGMRNDGSFDEGVQITNLLSKNGIAYDNEFRTTLSRVKSGKARFAFANQINDEVFRCLEEFLMFCNAAGIQVIAFLPPFADTVNREMEQSGKYGYMKDIHKLVLPVFEKYGFEMYDYTNINSFQASDEMMLDGFHIGEVGQANMLLSMLRHGSSLNSVCDSSLLKTEISEARNSLQVY